MAEAVIRSLTAQSYTIPTDGPEADGTIAWTATTIVIVEVGTGSVTGLGYTYADPSAVNIVSSVLTPEIVGGDALPQAACGPRWFRPCATSVGRGWRPPRSRRSIAHCGT